MVTLTGKEVNIVHDFLVDHGVDYEPLRDDLVDHLCCSIESKMESGMLFREAFSLSVEEFGELGIERTHQATIYLLTLKQRVMKNIASVTGITGSAFTIIGFTLKFLHLPPANILLVLGLSMIGLIFLPLILFIKAGEYKTLTSKLAIVAGVLSAFILLFGILFKMMHWPYANILTHLGMGVLCLVFMPLHFIRSYQQAENKMFNSALVLVIFAGSLLIFGMTNRQGNSHKLDDALAQNLNATIRSNNTAEDENNEMKKSLSDSLRNSTTLFTSVVEHIEKSEVLLFETVGYEHKQGAEIDPEHVDWNRSVVMINDFVTSDVLPVLEEKLGNGLNQWLNAPDGLSPEIKNHIAKDIRAFKGEKLSVRFSNLPLYEVISNLEELKQLCLRAESDVIMHLKHH
ncbi:MAG: GldL-related protein [Bacteroidota bacterium]